MARNNKLKQIPGFQEAQIIKNIVSANKKAESKSHARDAKVALYQMNKATSPKDLRNQEKHFKNAMRKSSIAWPANPDLKDINNFSDKIIKNARKRKDMR